MHCNPLQTIELTPSNWRQAMLRSFTRWQSLADFLQLDETQRQTLLKQPKFPLLLPYHLAQKIEKRTLHDPILKQFLPTQQELIEMPGYSCNPIGDLEARKSPNLLQKYQGRALLLCTGACAMNCRFCFRQNYDYQPAVGRFEKELQLISEDPSLSEIILSGGDPLALSDLQLEHLFEKLESIPHIRRLRIHTRFPIGIPERIDASFLQLIQGRKLPVWFVLHINHPKELDETLFGVFDSLRKKGAILLTQTVLLKGINDELHTLKSLFESLVNHGVFPYYLHQLDRVKGASHFEVDEEKGQNLITSLEKLLPGYAIPKYVREVAGEVSKNIIQ